MLTFRQCMVVAIWATFVVLTFAVGGPVSAAVLGLPGALIIGLFYWRQGRKHQTREAQQPRVGFTRSTDGRSARETASEPVAEPPA